MSPRLLPCPGCARHVRATEPLCPFCGDALTRTEGAPSDTVLPTRRLGRAATFAFGAAVAGATMTACAPMYGQPEPWDSGTTDTGTATDADVDADLDAARDAATDTGTADDAAPDALIDSGSFDAMYGGPPADSGSADDGALPDA